MILFKQVDELRAFLHRKREAGMVVGFVPTMGALHAGHLSLIRRSRRQTDLTVCSIFVNPTQFNEEADLDAYPRTEGQDLALLSQENCEVVFMPNREEVYPPDLDTGVTMDFGTLDKHMEGAHRPGHFEGMVQVVNRLLNIVQPHRLYMGQKDYQQFAIVQEMLRQQDSSVRIVRCPIVREESGLAMSSRNERLVPADRRRAAVIFEMLQRMRDEWGRYAPKELKARAIERLEQEPDFSVDYVEIADGYSLEPVTSYREGQMVIACAAVRVGDIRLIDNLILQPAGNS